MVRPRRLDDDALLERVADALQQRSSLTPWTLAEIAGQVGLSPAGLLKRFGSRRGVLLALSRRWIDSVPKRSTAAAMIRCELTMPVSDIHTDAMRATTAA